MAKGKSQSRGQYVYWTTEDGLLLLEAWARNGLSQEQIANNIGIRRQTLTEWMKRFPVISDAIRTRAKDISDIEVENALRKKALGYTITVNKPIKVRKVEYDDSGHRVKEYEEIVQAEEDVHVPADTQAAIFWLKNRKPDDWRDKREYVAEVAAQFDDGFLKALKTKTGEVFADGSDIPQNLDD